MQAPTIVLIVTVAAAALTAVAMVWDVKTRRIPNWLTVSGLLAGLVFHVAAAGWSGLGLAAGGFGTGFGLLFVLWLVGGGGGGDVKLMGALGAWLGAPLILIVFIVSAFLALVSVMAVLAWNLVARSTPAYGTSGGSGRSAGRQSPITAARKLIPYAVPLAAATWIVMGLKLLSVQAG